MAQPERQNIHHVSATNRAEAKQDQISFLDSWTPGLGWMLLCQAPLPCPSVSQLVCSTTTPFVGKCACLCGGNYSIAYQGDRHKSRNRRCSPPGNSRRCFPSHFQEEMALGLRVQFPLRGGSWQFCPCLSVLCPSLSLSIISSHSHTVNSGMGADQSNMCCSSRGSGGARQSSGVADRTQAVSPYLITCREFQRCTPLVLMRSGSVAGHKPFLASMNTASNAIVLLLENGASAARPCHDE